MPTDSPREPSALILAGDGERGRQRLEGCVRRVYRQAHDASISHFHEELLGLVDGSDQLLGVIGATDARRGELFLEAYLDRSIEDLLSRALGQEVPRRTLAEVGNLSAAQAGTATALVTTLAHRLLEEGLRFAVFTATASTRRVFRRMGAPLLQLAKADGQALGEDLVHWGRYYDCDPRVCAMDLARFTERAAAVPGLQQRLGHLWRAARGTSLRISA